MAKMLGNSPTGRLSIYHGWRGRKSSEVGAHKRKRRAQERDELRRYLRHVEKIDWWYDWWEEAN